MPYALQPIGPPISFLYLHFHDSIRTELEFLASSIQKVECAPDVDIYDQLLQLRDRYRFLEQVYSYHSSVEDEVVYPALDSKVRNVTIAYSFEHRDEELLFEQLSQLLAAALASGGTQRTETIRKLICKVQEIHTTLKKHLAKEEEQLLPLLVQHFTYEEQAELIAQFLYSIPLVTVERVLAWLKPTIPEEEQAQLLHYIRSVVPDSLLLQLLSDWLQPGSAALKSNSTTGEHDATLAAVAAVPATATMPSTSAFAGLAGTALECSRDSSHEAHMEHADSWPCAAMAEATAGHAPAAMRECAAGAPCAGPPLRAPLKDISHIHRSICSALEGFVQEARLLQRSTDVSSSQVTALVERHRFLRSVCLFHTASEEEVMYPEVVRLSPGHEGAMRATQQCTQEHEEEVSLLEDLGRLLADVRAFARRGRKEVSQMLDKLCGISERVCGAIAEHMRREERELFPLLERSMCAAQQRSLLWRTLQAMPLRLLERVMPWIVANLSDDDTLELLNNIRLGAPSADAVLVQLLSHWAGRGRDAAYMAAAGRAQEQQHGTAAAAAAAGGWGVEHPAGSGTMEASSCTAAASLAQAGNSDEAAAPLLGQQGLEVSGPAAAACPGLHGASQGLDQLFPNTTCEMRMLRPVPGSPGAKRQKLHADVDEGRAQHHSCQPFPQWQRQRSYSGGGAAAAEPHQQVLSCQPRQHSLGADAAQLPGSCCAAAESGQPLLSQQGLGEPVGVCQGLGVDLSGRMGGSGGFNPIDHIFQFHRALRLELRELEQDADRLQEAILAACSEQLAEAAAAVPDGSSGPAMEAAGQQQRQQAAEPAAAAGAAAAASAPSASAPWVSMSQMPRSCITAVQQLDGRFQFLWGIYRAHSRSEDEIVFPALESKHALRNVSHAYTLDHQQEEQLFIDLDQVISSLKTCGSAAAARSLTLDVRGMCAAIRASLETHVRSEESELWPLFAEHFSVEEQQYLVGVIIGRTGAQVLQTLLPWISESVTDDEKDVMMDSIRQVTKNTMFDQWLGAVQGQQKADTTATAAAMATPGSGAAAAGSRDDWKPLSEVAEYLASSAAAGDAGMPGEDVAAAGAIIAVRSSAAPAPLPPASGLCHHHPQGTVHHGRTSPLPAVPVAAVAVPVAAVAAADASTFRPGWEDIFRMNQKQLEAAIHRVSNDRSLEPERKAYLIQNIMVSRYIVAQQKRMRDQVQEPGAAPASQQGPGSTVASAVKTYHSMQAGVLGCQHYQRKCQLVAPCCDKVFTCRLCHDEASSHRMDRYAIKEMLCMECGHRQPVGQKCGKCGVSLAHYYCEICHLFDDDPTHDIYHCPFCNVCRRGRGLGVDFFHCMNCNACMSLSLFNSHVCREKAMEGDCPVCSECLFDSSQPIKELPCGHLMHSGCFAAYTRYNYTCPLCSKSIGDMTVYFQMLDSLLASERLPAEYAGRTQMVLCSDCGKSGFAPFHFVYHSCPHCRSYNTRVK